MNTPNPLMPQGSLLRPKGPANVRLAVVTIIAIHLVFFGSLLVVPGCKRENADSGLGASTNTNTVSAYTLPPVDTGYYTSASNLPQADTGPALSNPPAYTDTGVAAPATNFADTGVGTGSLFPPSGLDQLPGAPEVREYVVKSGDSFYKIAKEFNTTVGAIAKANPNVNPARLKVGQPIIVPVGSAGGAVSGSGSGGSTAGVSNDGSTTTYTVKAGDNLTKIARAHGTTVKAIRQANNMQTDRVNIGRKLKVPVKSNTTTNAPQDPVGIPANNQF